MERRDQLYARAALPPEEHSAVLSVGDSGLTFGAAL